MASDPLAGEDADRRETGRPPGKGADGTGSAETRGTMSRSYGFEADRRTVRPEEVATLRQVVDRLLDDEAPMTLTRVAAWLNETGQLTATGRP